MACFVVPAAEAAIVTVVTKVLKSKEKGAHEETLPSGQDVLEPVTVPVSKKLKWLTNLLWGGSALLMFEHVWHGELVPYFPFLTNAANPADALKMIWEMATAGVAMAAIVNAVWLGMLIVSSTIEKRERNQSVQVENGADV